MNVDSILAIALGAIIGHLLWSVALRCFSREAPSDRATRVAVSIESIPLPKPGEALVAYVSARLDAEDFRRVAHALREWLRENGCADTPVLVTSEHLLERVDVVPRMVTAAGQMGEVVNGRLVMRMSDG